MEFPKGPVCQSCGMPLRKDEDLGTKKDGSRSELFFSLFFENGRFSDEGIALEEKIEKNVKIGAQMGMPEDMARHMCGNILPKLRDGREGKTGPGIVPLPILVLLEKRNPSSF